MCKAKHWQKGTSSFLRSHVHARVHVCDSPACGHGDLAMNGWSGEENTHTHPCVSILARTSIDGMHQPAPDAKHPNSPPPPRHCYDLATSISPTLAPEGICS